MGDASRVIPGILHRDSLSTGLPIENSPPGIQTIPGGAGTGAGAVFGIVGANAAEAADTSVSSACGGEGGNPTGSLDRELFIPWTAKATATINPKVSNQRTCGLAFELVSSLIIFLTV